MLINDYSLITLIFNHSSPNLSSFLFPLQIFIS